MKVLAVFITILMLITGIDLCNKLNNYEEKGSTELSNSADEKHSDEAPCSPFCHCARCPFSIVQSSILKVLSVTFIKSGKYNIYAAPEPEQFASSIWQPPKTS